MSDLKQEMIDKADVFWNKYASNYIAIRDAASSASIAAIRRSPTEHGTAEHEALMRISAQSRKLFDVLNAPADFLEQGDRVFEQCYANNHKDAPKDEGDSIDKIGEDIDEMRSIAPELMDGLIGDFISDPEGHEDLFPEEDPIQDLKSTMTKIFNPTRNEKYANTAKATANNIVDTYVAALSQTRARLALMPMGEAREQEKKMSHARAFTAMMWELPADFRDGLVPAELGHRMHSAKVESDAAMTRLTATTDAHHAQNQQAMMDRANAFWERRGADFINRKAAAEAGVKKALSDVMKDGASSEQKLAAAARFSIHNATASQLEKPSNLLKTSKSLFEAHKANTEELARRKKRYGDQVEKDELAADDATLLNKLSAKDPLPNAAIAARNQLVEDLEEILNPTRDKAMERPARAVAENAALTFCARVVAGINAAHVQKDASDLAEGMPDKRIYTAAFEGMVKVLPPAFVSKLLNEQIEHDARVAGHETRDLPTNHIAQWAKPADRVVPLARKVEK